MKILTLAVYSLLLRLKERCPNGFVYFHFGQEQSFPFTPSSPPKILPFADGHKKVQDFAKGTGHRHQIPERVYQYIDRLLNVESLSHDTAYLLPLSQALPFSSVFSAPYSRSNLVSTHTKICKGTWSSFCASGSSGSLFCFHVLPLQRQRKKIFLQSNIERAQIEKNVEKICR